MHYVPHFYHFTIRVKLIAARSAKYDNIKNNIFDEVHVIFPGKAPEP